MIGTSVGALNAAWLAAHADVEEDVMVEGALEVWSQIRFSDVLRPLVTPAGSFRVSATLPAPPLAAGAWTHCSTRVRSRRLWRG